MEDVAKFLFGISGNVIALFLFLSPVPTFWRIIRNKSTEEFSGVPYNMTLLNCLLSAWYGLPFVSPNNVLVSTINGRRRSDRDSVRGDLPRIRVEQEGEAPDARPGVGRRGGVRGRRARLHARLARPGTQAPRRPRHDRLLHLHVRLAALHHEDGDQDEERGVHAVPAVAGGVPVRHVVVHLRLARPRPLRHGKSQPTHAHRNFSLPCRAIDVSLFRCLAPRRHASSRTKLAIMISRVRVNGPFVDACMGHMRETCSSKWIVPRRRG